MRTGQSLSEVSFVSLSSPHGHLSSCGSQLIRAVGLNLVSGNSQSRSKDAADERKRAASRSECVLATQMQCSLLFFSTFSVLLVVVSWGCSKREAILKCCKRNTEQAVILSYVTTCCYKPDCPEQNITASLISSKVPSFIFLTRTILLPVCFMRDTPDLQK